MAEATRNLHLVISVDGAEEAKTKVDALDKSLGKTVDTSKQAADNEKWLAESLGRGNAARQVATTSTLATAVATGQLRSATLATTVAMSGVAGTLFTTAAATTVVGTASTLAATAVGVFNTALGILGGPIGIAAILFTTALTKLLKDYIQSSGDAAVKAETLAAQQATVNRALELGADKGIKFADAMKFVDEAERHRQAMMPEVAAKQWVKNLTDQTTAAEKLRLEAEALRLGLEQIGRVQGFTADAGKILTEQYEAEQAAVKKATAAAKAHREELDRLAKKYQEFATGPTLQQLAEGLDEDLWAGPTQAQREMGDELDRLEPRVDSTVFAFSRLDGTLESVGAQSQATMADLDWFNHFTGPVQAVDEETSKWGDTLDDVENILQGINSRWAQMATVAVRTIRAIGENLAEGDIFGAVAAGVVGGIDLLSSAFGRNEEARVVNPKRDEFLAERGGLAAYHRALVEALGPQGDFLARQILMADTMAKFDAATGAANSAMGTHTAALAFQDSAMKQLDDTVKRYGFSIDQLGPILSKQKLDEQAAGLITDFRLLESAGIDVNNISIQMADSINGYLHNALKTGTDVPEAMRPILNQLATMGLLTDNNGDKIEDLEGSGVTFAQTLDDKFGDLITTIRDLTDAIARGLGLAIENVPDVDVDVNRNYRDHYENAGSDGPTYHQGGMVLPFMQRAHRGLAIDEVPIIAQTGEGVLNRGAMGLIGGAAGLNALNQGGGWTSADVFNTTIYVDGDINSPAARRKLQRVLDDTIRSAVAKRGRVA